jgi:hypothetical protein
MGEEQITDIEFETHVSPIAHENWATEHGHYPTTDAEFDEADRWAEYLRNSYNTGELEVTWR